MKLLTIIICSHERPCFLKNQLDSLLALINDCRSSVYVSDNSSIFPDKIRCIADGYAINLLSNPGGSSADNFSSFLQVPKSKYLMILHDDDITMIQDVNLFLNSLENINLPLLFAHSYAVEENQSFRVNAYNKSFALNHLQSISNYVFPFQLPAFPSLIYRWDHDFENIFYKSIIQRPAGKYSDSIVTVDICDHHHQVPRLVPGIILLCRWHKASDVQHYSLSSHFKLLKYTLPRLNAMNKLLAIYSYLLNLLRVILKRLIPK